MADTTAPSLFELHPTAERYELSSGAVCNVPYACRSADLLVLHGTADLSAVAQLLAGQRYRPVSVGEGRCAAALWFADYHDTTCGAYHEFIVTFAASLSTLEVPARVPLELLHAGAHPDATLLVHRLVLDRQVPIEYGREVHGFNKYPTPQPVEVKFAHTACRFKVACEGRKVVSGRIQLPQEAAPVQRVSFGYVTGAAVFQSRGVFHFDMQARFRDLGDEDKFAIGKTGKLSRELRDIDYVPRLVQFLPQARFVMPKPSNWRAFATEH
jgi:hypothetical protein